MVLARQPLPPVATDFLSLLGPINRGRFLAGSTRSTHPAGTIFARPDGPPIALLLACGLARAYWSLANGKQATVAIVRSDELVGATTLTGLDPSSYIQLLTESTVISLDLETVRELAATELEVATAVSKAMAMRLRDAAQLVAVCSLGNIRQRVAYDLLNRASQSEFFVGRLNVRTTHEELADSVGSSREVVSRALRSLRMEGIVETAPGTVSVVDPARLAAIVRPFVM